MEATTPQQPYSVTPQERRFSNSGNLESEIAFHVHILSDQGTPLPPVTSSKLLSSSPNLDPDGRGQFEPFSKRTITPQPKKRLEEAFSGQTATPPHTASKGNRKLAPKPSNESMQSSSQDTPFGVTGTPTQNNIMSFTSTPGDIFGYPMSAPATAPVFTATKPFWDPDTSMNAMDIDFISTEDAGVFNQSSHRISSSFDWGRNNQMFQDTVKFPPNPKDSIVSKRQRPLAPKTPSAAEQPTTGPYSFVSTGVSSDPFTAPVNVLDPGLLYSRHNSIGSGFGDVTVPGSRPVAKNIGREPYQHQLRESRRDQEDLRRSRTSREGKKSFNARGTVSSPVRASSSSLTESRGKRSQGNISLEHCPARADLIDRLSRNGRSSPIKHQPTASLTSIPESHVTGVRTEMKLTIDANGRARTETVIVGREERAVPSPASKGEWDSSPYESSTDDEDIILPSRNTSFALPSQSKVPKLSKHDTTAHHRGNIRRRSTGGSGYSHSESSNSTRIDGAESEAETLMGQEDQSGDAMHELRKVMESRSRGRKKPQGSSHHYYSDSRGSYYGSYNTNNLSPTTVTDPDGATPSSTRSGSTRCVCNNPDSGGFMIQW